MTDQIIYNSDEVRHIGAQIGDATETYAGTATDRIMDAAHNQGEGKWGSADLGAPAKFGSLYSQRLIDLETQITILTQKVEDFSHLVKDVATRADVADEEVAEVFIGQEFTDVNIATLETGNGTHSVEMPKTRAW